MQVSVENTSALERRMTIAVLVALAMAAAATALPAAHKKVRLDVFEEAL